MSTDTGFRAEKQGDFALRRTGNYFDLIEGRQYHLQPITFYEFLSKPEALFMYDTTFFQIPGYVQKGAELREIEEDCRQFVVNYIMEQFEHKLLGMQDYLRWGKLFKNRCDAVALAFWAQVNMHDLMFAKDLEMDENDFERTNTGKNARLGSQIVTTDQTGESATIGKSKTKSAQDSINTQDTDAYSREANATVVRAEDQLTADINYNWQDAADNVREMRNRAGDTSQHIETESETENESQTNTNSHTVSTSTMDNSSDESGGKSNEHQNLTNKQFMQEKQWAINTARELLPLEWLRVQLAPMFYMLY
ncbi:MAG: hypothetical protein FWF15_03510 [Oscillospiraceae bacterium]|nr:hypothetical protein [Oscillospiraceae bacterium]